MKRNILVAGLLGGIVMTLWLFVSNAVLPVKQDLMNRKLPLDDQQALHGVLADHVPEPGHYSVPYLTREEEDRFPDYRNLPVYTIQYEGFTHGEGSQPTLTPLLAIFLASFIVSWMLASAGSGILSHYWRRVLFVVAIGVVIALADDVLQMSFGPQPANYLTFLAINNLVTWLLAGLVIGWRIRPVRD
jgi:hypothetical protein